MSAQPDTQQSETICAEILGQEVTADVIDMELEADYGTQPHTVFHVCVGGVQYRVDEAATCGETADR